MFHGVSSNWKVSMNKHIPIICCFAACIPGVASAADPRCADAVDLVQPAQGVIGDAKIAETVALAYLTQVYGEVTLRKELPLRAELKNGIWTVTGTLPREAVGGAAEILLCQRNGTVLRIIHYK